MENKKQRFFALTQVERIIAVLAFMILFVIAWISFSWACAKSRDMWRITHIKKLHEILLIEEIKWKLFSDIILKEKTNDLFIDWLSNISHQGIIDFDLIEIDKDLYKDPLTWDDYVFAYTYWKCSSDLSYSFIQLATISEINEESKVVWNYYKYQESDSLSIITDSQWVFIEEWCKNLPYKIKGWVVVSK